MLRIVAVIKQRNTVIGYRIFNEQTKEIYNWTMLDTFAYMRQNPNIFSNAQLDNNTIILTDVQTINSLPVVHTERANDIENNRFSVYAELWSGNKVVGYRVVDAWGNTLEWDFNSFVAYGREKQFANAIIRDNNGSTTVYAKKGNLRRVNLGGNTSAVKPRSRNGGILQAIANGFDEIAKYIVWNIQPYIDVLGVEVKVNPDGNVQALSDGSRKVNYQIEASSKSNQKATSIIGLTIISTPDAFQGVLTTQTGKTFLAFNIVYSEVQRKLNEVTRDGNILVSFCNSLSLVVASAIVATRFVSVEIVPSNYKKRGLFGKRSVVGQITSDEFLQTLKNLYVRSATANNTSKLRVEKYLLEYCLYQIKHKTIPSMLAKTS